MPVPTPRHRPAGASESRARAAATRGRVPSLVLIAALTGGLLSASASAAWAAPRGQAEPAVASRAAKAPAGPSVDSFWLATTTGKVWAFGDASSLRGAGTFTGTLADVVPDDGYTGPLTADLGGAQGYWMVSASGEVVPRGIASTYKAVAAGSRPDAPVSDLTPTPDWKGYWLVSANGDVTAYGDAHAYGVGHDPATGGGHVIRLVATPDAEGYWLFSADGSVQAFGDAVDYGPKPGAKFNGQVVDMAAAANGKGYWELTALGGVYSYGDAKDYGEHRLSSADDPDEKLVADPAGTGYWVEDQDGSSWAFGSALHAPPLLDDPFNPPGSAPLEALVFHPTTVGDRAVMYALSQLGKKYVYGDIGPKDYDCSGLVYRAYLTVTGKAMSTVAADQYHSGGTRVTFGQLQTGDPLFYSPNTSKWQDVSTVALYVGGGGLVEADVPAVQTYSVGVWGRGLMPYGVHPSVWR